MLRPVRSAAPSAERATGADAVPAVASAFQLAHGYVAWRGTALWDISRGDLRVCFSLA